MQPRPFEQYRYGGVPGCSPPPRTWLTGRIPVVRSNRVARKPEKHMHMDGRPPLWIMQKDRSAGPADMPLQSWWLIGTKNFRLHILVNWKWLGTTQPCWVINPVPHSLVRRTRYGSIYPPEQIFLCLIKHSGSEHKSLIGSGGLSFFLSWGSKTQLIRAVLIRIPNRKPKQSSLSGMFCWIPFIPNQFLDDRNRNRVVRVRFECVTICDISGPNLFC